MTKFFEPSEKFLDWLANYIGEGPAIDIGAGEGHITEALIKRKVKCVGIEPLWDEYPKGFNYIIPSYAEDLSIIKNWPALLLFCRPCHSGFVMRVIERAHPDSKILYISKPGNLSIDIDLFKYNAIKLKTPKCPEENVYNIIKKE